MSKTTKKAIEKLSTMKVNELQAKFAEVTGETTRSPNKTYAERGDMRSRWPARRVLRRERPRATPHIARTIAISR